MAEPHVFSIEEANSLVPFLRERFEKINSVRERLRQVREDLKVFADIWGKQILEAGNPDYALYRAKAKELDAVSAELKAEAQLVAEKGCVLKGIEEGLVDFYHDVGGEVVCLCWKFPEEAVAFWHRTTSGFLARKPLDELPAKAQARI